MPPGRHAPSVTTVRNVPWWGLFSSGAAPVLMVGGWTVATGLQSQPVDPVAETVSSLAAVDAAERWVMTATFLAVGVCYVATGLALRPAAAAGRLILVAGAGAGMLVAAFPQPADGGGSLLHAVWASVGFGALAVWPAAAWRRGPGVPWALRPAVCAVAAAALVLLLAWFAAEVVTGAGQAGLAERVLGEAQAVWPLTVVLSCRHPARAAPEPAAADPAHGAEPAGRPEIQADASLAGPPDTGLPRVPADGTPPWTSAPPRSPGQLGHAPLASLLSRIQEAGSPASATATRAAPPAANWPAG
jgi:Protein of unknown function (DUF998)